MPMGGGAEMQAGDVTVLLERVRGGDKDAENRLYELVMPHLRRIAHSLLNRERPDHSLQATELVNEVYMRLAGAELSLRDRSQPRDIARRSDRRPWPCSRQPSS